MKTIFVAYDHDKKEYVWAETAHDLQVKSPTWAHQGREVKVTDAQLEKLRNGGWIFTITSWGGVAVCI